MVSSNRSLVESMIGAPNGLAALDADTKVPDVQLPARLGAAALPVNAKTDFDAKGDDTADDTAALQAFIDYCINNHRRGEIPNGVYKITAPLLVRTLPEWSIIGAGPGVTIIKQYADDVPIFTLGDATQSFMHSFEISGMMLEYANDQPATNLNANPILFATMVFQGRLIDMRFLNGSYAMRVVDGIGCPWGVTFDDLRFGSGLTLGAMDWSQGVNGVPNNRFGRIFCDCLNMAGPVFNVRGYNFQIDTIEFIAANQGPCLFLLAAGGKVNIGTMKLENGIYNANRSLFDFQGKSNATIGNITVGGHTMKVGGGALVSVLRVDQGFVDLGYLETELSEPIAGGGSFYATSSSGALSIGRYVTTFGNTTGLHNNGGSVGGNHVTVRDRVSGRLSDDRGDADYTVEHGDPNLIAYQTPLTAPRMVTLPADGPNLFNGLSYEVIVNGAVNGASTLTIKAGATVLHEQATDKAVIGFTWRRHPNPVAGWVMAKYETLP